MNIEFDYVAEPASSHRSIPCLGAGVGLRRIHHNYIIETNPLVNWFEILTENYLNRGGPTRRELLQIAERYPMVSHGVAMSIGGTDALDWDHLRAVKELNDDTGVLWTSEHLCFSQVNHTNLSGLIPLPFTEDTVKHVAKRVRQVTESLELPLLLENVTYYMVVSDREMSELEFVNAVLEEADCGLLLDVNNVYINASNHGYDAADFIKSIPPERIGQIHLGGHDDQGTPIKDTHDRPVRPEVWQLFEIALDHAGPVSTNIEWDKDLPPWASLADQADHIQRLLDAREGG